jgi:hypothetical protein
VAAQRWGAPVSAVAGSLRGGRGCSPLGYEVPGTAGFALAIGIGGARTRRQGRLAAASRASA